MPVTFFDLPATEIGTMQRNEVDAALSSIGLGTPDVWQKLGQELEGKTQLEQPRVSKKVLVKALRMQTEAMRYMVDEFDRLRDKMAEMEREARNTAKHVERVNSKLITVQGQVDDVNTKVYELEVVQTKQAEQLKEIDDVAVQVRAAREEVQHVAASVEKANTVHNEFVQQTEQKLSVIREDHEVTKQFAMKIEDRLNEEQKELFLDSDHILHNKLSLAMWMEAVEKDNRRKDDALRDCTEKMTKQGRNVQDMMLETRRTLDDNTCAVEDVQRLLLEKADRTRVDEIIESKYEEICNQLDKALASVLGEEDEFKRASQELQQLVTHLSESKADKKDLLEVKEQVLYDSRVRQQVENLRSFIDIKMNRDDVFSALKSKADKDEMLALLKNLSDSMNASIVQAQKSLNYAESAFLTGKQTGHQHGGGCNSSQKRGGMLPSLDREKCLSCNSQLRDPSTTPSGPITHKNPFQMAPVYGGGFHLPAGAGSIEKNALRNRSNGLSNNNSASAPYLSPRTVANMASSGQLAESASEGFLVGVDGRVYQADPDVVAQVQERTRSNPGFKLPQAVGPRKTLSVHEEGD
ncbi:Dipeptidyl peptidase 2 [Phytophthora pseudosyringae]|uniref:Dipeptidyl peptidase 2 n=1 Tax=Phytophthora pseudosyringae TaxID=221518 RepID=A0A8T1W0A4_9STRA|nr:Dipeptidyl peptidase 2 [Phytophthora pseudosyringae]